MKWEEFKDLLSGLGPDTPLGRVVSIRAEEDKEVLKNFTKDMHKIRNNYRRKGAKKMDRQTYDKEMKNLEFMFKSLCS